MNNQFILPPIIFIIIKMQKSNIINMIKLFLSLKYIWGVLVAWYLFMREKTKNIVLNLRFKWFEIKSKNDEKSVDKIFKFN